MIVGFGWKNSPFKTRCGIFGVFLTKNCDVGADQLVWRAAAETQVRPGVEAYLNAIKGNIGARSQEDLTRKQALFLASCTSHHKDLSLNF